MTCFITRRNGGRLPTSLTCVREKCTLAEAGFKLAVNAERHIKPADEMARLFKNFPMPIARTVAIAAACRFSLDQLRYEYPDEPVPPGKTAQQHLTDLTWTGAAKRYPKALFPNGIPQEVAKRLNDELALIEELKYAHYFLTVHDVVAYAREQKNILCQGRGSAANSAVCYCLGITEVNPAESELLFARFISANRGEPPDIDVDFEHERREEVIQYIYERYGRHRAAICATVIHYRSRRAIREVGKVLGLTEDVTAALAKTVWGYSDDGLPDDHIRQAGLDPANPAIRQAIALAGELIGFPRHLSQHVGGFVLTRGPLDETGAHRQCRDGRAHLHRMGQGRHRYARPDEGRCARARHAELPAPRPRSFARALRRGLCACDHSERRHGGRRRPSTRCCRAPTRSACSRSRAARRCRCCRG